MRSKCICIKDYYNTKESIPTFRKGEIYEYTDQQFVTRDYPEGYNVKFYPGNYIYFRKHQDPKAEKGFGLFSTYFITVEELREDKLNQILENEQNPME